MFLFVCIVYYVMLCVLFVDGGLFVLYDVFWLNVC